MNRRPFDDVNYMFAITFGIAALTPRQGPVLLYFAMNFFTVWLAAEGVRRGVIAYRALPVCGYCGRRHR